MQNRNLVIIDPGHGGADSGAVSGSFVEKAINLFVAHYLWLYCGDLFHTFLTRSSDYSVNLFDRCLFSKLLSCMVDRSIFVSLHVNASRGAPEAKGHSIFYCDKSAQGKRLALSIHQNVVTSFPELPIYNTGVLPDSFISSDGFTVLRRTVMPAVLCEFLFITNKDDQKFLGNSHVLENYAIAIFNGIKEYFEGD